MDGHEREDVVQYRNEFIKGMADREIDMPLWFRMTTSDWKNTLKIMKIKENM